MQTIAAQKQTGVWQDRRAIALLMAASLTTMANATISPALAGLEKAFAADPPNAEMLTRLLVPTPSLSVVLFAPLAGLVADRFGRRWLLLAGVILFGLRFGINICYDTNFPGAARQVANGGASLIVCPANNMMPRHKAEQFISVHNAVRGERCRETGLWLISADVTGERDGNVAWGPTAVLNPNGEVEAQLPLGAPGLLVFDLPLGTIDP